MATATNPNSASPAFVGACAWLLPGLGYWVLGQRSRGLTVGITILALFLIGVLIGGIRIIEVPGYGSHGLRNLVLRDAHGRSDDVALREPLGDFASWNSSGWALVAYPFDEIREKPWSIPQVLAGPISIVAGAWSVKASASAGEGLGPVGARSHSHINEIGVLYTAVAGMLNLLAILDCTYRAAHASADEEAGRDAGEARATPGDAERGGATA